MGKLSAEARRELAGKAARARWRKNRDQEAAAPATIPATPPKKKKARSASIPTASSAPAAKPRPPVRPGPFRGAHSYAEKRLAAALKERAQAMNKVAMLNAEIPSLVEIINALQGQRNPQAVPAGALDLASIVAGGAFAPEARPAAPQVPRVAQGAAVGGIDLGDESDEDRFLRESPVAGGQWH